MLTAIVKRQVISITQVAVTGYFEATVRPIVPKPAKGKDILRAGTINEIAPYLFPNKSTSIHTEVAPSNEVRRVKEITKNAEIVTYIAWEPKTLEIEVAITATPISHRAFTN
ncbi:MULTISPECIES: hypothetical protein [Kamptonema]|uniref:hypothetical protein n=1 Tax=Kamptonema TaxID=1501433 RepID=UPI000373CB07|nr:MULTISPECIES: hypothetical protein [Kamptonema]